MKKSYKGSRSYKELAQETGILERNLRRAFYDPCELSIVVYVEISAKFGIDKDTAITEWAHFKYEKKKKLKNRS